MTTRCPAHPRSPVWEIWQTGKAVEAPVLTDEPIRASCVDGHQVERVHRLGARRERPS